MVEGTGKGTWVLLLSECELCVENMSWKGNLPSISKLCDRIKHK